MSQSEYIKMVNKAMENKKFETAVQGQMQYLIDEGISISEMDAAAKVASTPTSYGMKKSPLMEKISNMYEELIKKQSTRKNKSMTLNTNFLPGAIQRIPSSTIKPTPYRAALRKKRKATKKRKPSKKSKATKKSKPSKKSKSSKKTRRRTRRRRY